MGSVAGYADDAGSIVKTYAGVGARATPATLAAPMAALARALDARGYTLHSGGAAGADTFFEAGATHKVIFIHVDGARGRSQYTDPCVRAGVCERALRIAFNHHPAWGKLSATGRLLMGRNSYQVLGADLQSPVEFVACWTADGKASGGTGQAIRVAEAYGIPVFNLHDPQRMRELFTRFDVPPFDAGAGKLADFGVTIGRELCTDAGAIAAALRERQDDDPQDIDAHVLAELPAQRAAQKRQAVAQRRARVARRSSRPR